MTDPIDHLQAITPEEIRRFRRDNLAELAFPILLKHFLWNTDSEGNLAEKAATACYAYADAMLARSEEKPPQDPRVSYLGCSA